MKRLIPFLSSLRLLVLGIWLGALIMLGYAVAGPIFQLSMSKTLAGEINGVILGRMNSLEWICAAIALVTAAVSLWNSRTSAGVSRKVGELAVIVASCALLYTYSCHITTRMQELRGEIKDFDHPSETPAYVSAKSEFDQLHHTYTSLVGANMALLLASFVLGAKDVRSHRD